MSGPRHDPFGRSRLPDDLEERARADIAQAEREEREAFARRAAWLHEVRVELLGGRPASPAARVFVGGGLDQVIEENGDLLEVLRLRPSRGKKNTARRVLGERGKSGFHW